MTDFSKTWLRTLATTLMSGSEVSPRGKLTREILQRTTEVDMTKPVLMVPNRSLSYTFMLAEAYWILCGDNRVSTIAPYNSRIADFSDDGKIFFGAYGPRIALQINYVVNKLIEDPDTRQAGLTIWNECPPATKDVPCTVSIFFNTRDDKLSCHVFMRSSDIWLGLPYDVFNFSMLSHLVCCQLNAHRKIDITPGRLYLTAASSHLYAENFELATKCVNSPGIVGNPLPTEPQMWQDSSYLMQKLKTLRDEPPTSKNRWWRENI